MHRRPPARRSRNLSPNRCCAWHPGCRTAPSALLSHSPSACGSGPASTIVTGGESVAIGSTACHGLARRLRGCRRGGARVGAVSGFVGFQERVALHRPADLEGKIQRRKLQQPNGLLQAGGQCLLLSVLLAEPRLRHPSSSWAGPLLLSQGRRSAQRAGPVATARLTRSGSATRLNRRVRSRLTRTLARRAPGERPTEQIACLRDLQGWAAASLSQRRASTGRRHCSARPSELRLPGGRGEKRAEIAAELRVL